MRPGHLVERVHAVLLSGGSAFGLDAAGGVMRFLEERGVGLEFGDHVIPIVPSAILFDLGIGRADKRPDIDSGYRAAKAAKGGKVKQGSVGAGTGATVAKAGGTERRLKGGIGTSCETGANGLLAGAIAAVNSVGDIIDPDRGRVIAGPRSDKPGKFLNGWKLVRDGGEVPSGNTTLAIVATNAALTKQQANRLASVAQDGLARTIRPAHGMNDGDTVFVLATGELELDAGGYRGLEAIAVRAIERAIIRGVRNATGLAGIPSAGEWQQK
jgi:L-aminopeptidase/D-esterase-like protein